MVTILPSEDCIFRLDSKYGFNHASNLPVTYTDITLDDKGFGFNGSSSKVDCGNDTRFNITDEITLEAWIYLNNITLPEQAIIVKSDGSVTGTQFELRTSGTFLQFIISDGTTWKIATKTGITANTLIHVMGILVGGFLYAYVDNIASSPIAIGAYSTTTNPVTIGERTTNLYFDGIIAEANIYNRALTAQEVADRYNKYTFGGHL